MQHYQLSFITAIKEATGQTKAIPEANRTVLGQGTGASQEMPRHGKKGVIIQLVISLWPITHLQLAFQASPVALEEETVPGEDAPEHGPTTGEP